MERQLPKNVRQIGNVSDTPKIYVEDYVDTFLNQMCEKAEELPLGAFLVGERAKDEDEEYIYIYGAVQMHELRFVNKEYIISEDTWKNAYEDCKQYFEEGEMLGWFVTAPGETTALSHNLSKLHKSSFPTKNSVLIVKEPLEKEEIYYVHKFGELLPMNGHYTYYEKNPCMQNYMISSRKKNGVTPSETAPDRAAKDFRSLIRTREELKNQKRTTRIVYIGGSLLIIVLVFMGVMTVTNIGRMRSMQSTIAGMNSSSEKAAQKEEAQTENQETNLSSNLNDGQAQDKLEEDTNQTISSAEDQVNNTDENTAVTDNENETVEASSANISNAEEVPQTIGQEEVAEAKQEDEIYVVKEGDTLASISEKIYGDVNHVNNICNMNGLTDSNLIYIGQKLLIP